MNSKAYISDFLGGIEKICQQIDRAKIEKATDMIFQTWKTGKQVFLIGNGGSASTATHFACDLSKCTWADGKRRLRVQSLVDNIPLLTALTNDCGWSSVYIEQLRSHLTPGDLLIAISVHGGSGKDKAEAWSQNLVQGIKYAKENGAATLGFSGFDGGLFNEVCDLNLIVPYNTTPHVEAFHVTLHHLITWVVMERIRASN